MRRRLGYGGEPAVWPWLVFAAVLVGLTLLGLVGAVADLQAGPLGMVIGTGLMGLGMVATRPAAEEEDRSPFEAHGWSFSWTTGHGGEEDPTKAKTMAVLGWYGHPAEYPDEGSVHWRGGVFAWEEGGGRQPARVQPAAWQKVM